MSFKHGPGTRDLIVIVIVGVTQWARHGEADAIGQIPELFRAHAVVQIEQPLETR